MVPTNKRSECVNKLLSYLAHAVTREFCPSPPGYLCIALYVRDRRIVVYQNLEKSKYISLCVAEDSPVQRRVQAAAPSPLLLGRIYKWLWLRKVFTSPQNTRSHTYVLFRTQKPKPT